MFSLTQNYGSGVSTIVVAIQTEQLVATAQSTVEIKDSTGRTLTLRKAPLLSQYKLVEAIGDAAQNSVYMGMVFPLLYVAAIDGQPLNPLTSKLQVESLIQRLDEEGMAAVMEGVTTHFGKKQAPEADKDALKNS